MLAYWFSVNNDKGLIWHDIHIRRNYGKRLKFRFKILIEKRIWRLSVVVSEQGFADAHLLLVVKNPWKTEIKWSGMLKPKFSQPSLSNVLLTANMQFEITIFLRKERQNIFKQYNYNGPIRKPLTQSYNWESFYSKKKRGWKKTVSIKTSLKESFRPYLSYNWIISQRFKNFFHFTFILLFHMKS